MGRVFEPWNVRRDLEHCKAGGYPYSCSKAMKPRRGKAAGRVRRAA